MKIGKILLLVALALGTTFATSCSKDETKKIIDEVVTNDLDKVAGTWEGTYTPGISEDALLTEKGTIEIQKVGNKTDELIINTKANTGLKIKITSNSLGILTGTVEPTDEVKEGSLNISLPTNDCLLNITKTDEKGKSYAFKGNKKQ